MKQKTEGGEEKTDERTERRKGVKDKKQKRDRKGQKKQKRDRKGTGKGKGRGCHPSIVN